MGLAESVPQEPWCYKHGAALRAGCRQEGSGEGATAGGHKGQKGPGPGRAATEGTRAAVAGEPGNGQPAFMEEQAPGQRPSEQPVRKLPTTPAPQEGRLQRVPYCTSSPLRGFQGASGSVTLSDAPATLRSTRESTVVCIPSVHSLWRSDSSTGLCHWGTWTTVPRTAGGTLISVWKQTTVPVGSDPEGIT